MVFQWFFNNFEWLSGSCLPPTSLLLFLAAPAAADLAPRPRPPTPQKQTYIIWPKNVGLLLGRFPYQERYRTTLKTSPRRFQDVPKTRQDAPRRSQDVPQTPPDAPKTLPRRPQNAEDAPQNQTNITWPCYVGLLTRNRARWPVLGRSPV